MYGQSVNRVVEICPNPVFIIGSPRSATTVLAFALGEHSHFWASTESQILVDLFTKQTLYKNYKRAEPGGGGSWLVRQGIERPQFLAFLGLGFNALFTSTSKGLRWLDHTPDYTFLVDEMAQMFPGASFLHLLRDGRRVVRSMINYRPENIEDIVEPLQRPPPWAFDFATACKAWTRYVSCAVDFSQRHPSRCLTVITEELITDPSCAFKHILAFLEEPFEEAPVRYFQSKRMNSSFPRESPHLAGEPWRSWSNEQKKIFESEAGKAMEAAQCARDTELHRRESAPVP